METVSIDTTQVKKEEKQVAAIYIESTQITISNQEQYEGASEFLKRVKAKIKDLDTLRKSITKPLDTAKQKVMDLFNPPITALKRAESGVKREMIKYDTEQEKIREEHQKKLQQQAEEKARKEREALEARAKKWEEKGKEEKAEALREQAEEIEPEAPVVAPIEQKPKGVSYREKWSAEVIDVNQVPREYMIPNQQALDKVAQATKGSITIPGVKFKKEKILSSRAA